MKECAEGALGSVRELKIKLMGGYGLALSLLGLRNI
jgi:hypothetical protein